MERLIGEDDRERGRLCQLNGGGYIIATGVLDGGLRRLRLNVFQRGRREVDGLAPVRTARPWIGGVAAGCVDLRGAAAREDAYIGVGSDERDGGGTGFQRKNGAGVFEQNDALFGDVLGVVASAKRIDYGADGRIVDDAGGEHAAQNAMDHVVQASLGDLDRVTAWLMVNGFINAEPGYSQTTAVMNPLSDLILELYGTEAGAHARTAIGVATVPLDLPLVIAAEVAIS